MNKLIYVSYYDNYKQKHQICWVGFNLNEAITVAAEIFEKYQNVQIKQKRGDNDNNESERTTT